MIILAFVRLLRQEILIADMLPILGVPANAAELTDAEILRPS
jgi:hypothetical protein